MACTYLHNREMENKKIIPNPIFQLYRKWCHTFYTVCAWLCDCKIQPQIPPSSKLHTTWQLKFAFTPLRERWGFLLSESGLALGLI